MGQRMPHGGHRVIHVRDIVLGVGHPFIAVAANGGPVGQSFEEAGQVGALLRAARVAAGLQVGELAKKLRQSRRTVSRWELDYTRPRESMRRALLAALADAPFAERAELARRLGLVAPASEAIAKVAPARPYPSTTPAVEPNAVRSRRCSSRAPKISTSARAVCARRSRSCCTKWNDSASERATRGSRWCRARRSGEPASACHG